MTPTPKMWPHPPPRTDHAVLILASRPAVDAEPALPVVLKLKTYPKNKQRNKQSKKNMKLFFDAKKAGTRDKSRTGQTTIHNIEAVSTTTPKHSNPTTTSPPRK